MPPLVSAAVPISVRQRRRALVAGLAVVTGAALAACGSSTPSSGAARRSSARSTTAASASTAPSVSTGSAASSSASSAGSTSGSPGAGTSVFPAVGNATDLSVEPTFSAGTPPPSSTLQTRDLVVGTGATATSSSTVKIQYAGANYATGKVFDASWTDNGPITEPLSDFVAGFSQGIVGMKVGGRREIVIPPDLGYGNSSDGPISAGETLVFVVDLLAVQ